MFFVITRFRKKTSTAKLNTPLGMVLVHIGLALLAFGILGVENFTSRYEIGLQAGDSLELMGWTVNAVSREVVPAETSGGQDSNAFILQFKSASGKVIFLEPEIKSYPKLDIEESLPDFHSNLFQDVHVVMSDWNVPDSHLAEFQVSFLPSMMWIWIGGLVMVMGGLHTLRAYLIK
jgi:cytochrome c-type biogenesis protein CcmF